MQNIFTAGLELIDDSLEIAVRGRHFDRGTLRYDGDGRDPDRRGRPDDGKDAWFGAQLERGAALAVADLNAAGGVLGQQVQLITADDFCDPEQAVAAARKLVSEGVIFVVGHYCSHSSIPASEIYEAAGVLMISPASSNPMLTELGRANVFRVQTRDDVVGVVAGDYLADHWADKKIAILHDNTTFGKGLAELTKKQLNDRGVTEAIYQAYIPGQNNYGAEIDALYAADIAVAFVGGYHTEIALMARAAHDRGYPVQLIAGLNLATEEFGLIAGPGAEGTLFIDNPDPRRNAEAAPVVERFRASGYRTRGLHAERLWRRSGLGAGGRESRLARAPGDDRIPAATPVRHRAGPDRLR